MLSIESGPFRLAATPALGGSLAALEWQGHPLLRPQQGQDVLGSACFPLLPFSNRLRASRFSWHGQTINLDPNHPHDPSEPVLHGFGWRQPWQVSAHAPDRLALSLHMPAGPWPWPFHAEQLFVLDARHAQLSLAITNLGPTPMPAGLGFHPYFPRDAATVLHALHSGEWQVDAARLPTHLIRHDTAIDWWHGQPVATRPVDTVYTGRTGPLAIHWPGRGIGLTITPDASLSCTTIYVPPAQPFFCVEPVSHATDALNRPGTDHGMRLLAPGERWQVTLRLTPFMRP